MEKAPPPALEARGISRRFHGFLAINNVDLTIQHGAIHALIGPNGAGKSTCFNLLTCALPVTQGRIFHRGEDITPMATADVARRGIVRSFQISAVFPSMSVLENLKVALARPARLATQFWYAPRALDVLNDRALELIDWVGLAPYAHEAAGRLPYGRKRALELATTLALEPDILLLDEPMAGMGREDIASIAALIRRVAVGRTVVMVEHNLGVVRELCDRVTVLARGTVIAEGSYEEVSLDSEVRSAYIGTAAC